MGVLLEEIRYRVRFKSGGSSIQRAAKSTATGTRVLILKRSASGGTVFLQKKETLDLDNCI
jgi:hypothetical protein